MGRTVELAVPAISRPLSLHSKAVAEVADDSQLSYRGLQAPMAWSSLDGVEAYRTRPKSRLGFHEFVANGVP